MVLDWRDSEGKEKDGVRCNLKERVGVVRGGREECRRKRNGEGVCSGEVRFIVDMDGREFREEGELSVQNYLYLLFDFVFSKFYLSNKKFEISINFIIPASAAKIRPNFLKFFDHGCTL